MRHLLPMLLLLLPSCHSGGGEPQGLLDRRTFVLVLTEAQLIEARMNHEMTVRQRTEVPMAEYYQEVFDRYGTDREQFENTFHYYASRPEELQAIYEEVLVEMGRRKDQVPSDAPAPEGQ